ncbi:MAG TPA: N,N-dimethylformamidase beta subunit family domain-containing protein, partial [Ilumatobacteraceae bacterium]|nr:N,N-dimethylformamidase beta subunit family domain-containing protein [Ilumatobacteraceae bacterium]
YDFVEAYAGRSSYTAGDTVTLHVSCRAETYDIEIARWGSTRVVVWTATGREGIEHATPSDADAHGCGWPVSETVVVPDDWRSGFYLVTLRAHGVPSDRATGYACFVVRASVRRSAALLVIATNTYNAYNNWGGRSLYTGGKQVSFRRPFGRGLLCRPETERDDRKSRPRRFREDPDIDGATYQEYRYRLGYPGFMSSAGWLTYERRLVEWAEAAGFNFDYAVSSDLERVPRLCDGYSVVIGAGHDEYWSAAQRDAVEAHVRDGGNYLSMSGNTMFWHVRLEDDGDTMVCHKYTAHETDPVIADDPSSGTGMWCDPVVGRPEASFLGAGSAWGLYSRFGAATPRGSGGFTVYRNDHWLFADTGLRYGDVLGADDGVVGYETVGCRINFDEYQLPVAAGGDATPADIEVVAFTPSSNLAMGEYPASIAALDDQGDLEFIAGRLFGRVDDDSLARIRHGNAVIVTCRPFGDDGGQVVTIGSTDWVFGLAGDAAVGQVTRNALTHLGAAAS